LSEFTKRMLTALLVLGASAPERSMGTAEVAERLGMDTGTVERGLRELVDAGYAQFEDGPHGQRVCLTGTGVITASSTYS